MPSWICGAIPSGFGRSCGKEDRPHYVLLPTGRSDRTFYVLISPDTSCANDTGSQNGIESLVRRKPWRSHSFFGDSHAVEQPGSVNRVPLWWLLARVYMSLLSVAWMLRFYCAAFKSCFSNLIP